MATNLHSTTLQLTIEEGTNSMLTMHAKRVAFSAVGTVKLLDGNPEKNCVLQALALDGSGAVEEGTSDAQGSFRIRGLKPGVGYSIRVSTSATRHERGSPSAIAIEMSSGGDYTKGLDFMAFRRSKLLDLVGSVDTEEAHLSSITVQACLKNREYCGAFSLLLLSLSRSLLLLLSYHSRGSCCC